MENRIPLFKVFLPPEDRLMPKLKDVLYSGQISEGQPVYDFEDKFGAYVGNPNILSFYSGTAALHAALILAGVREGDEVISTAMTAEPTNMAILHAGARIVWADVRGDNGLLDPDAVAAAITPRTKAIMVVHYGGLLAEIDRINEIAARFGIPVIEDAAHAFGARYRGRRLGSDSAFTMYSLQAIKHMTTVDGGMLVCQDPGLLDQGRRVKWFGIDRRAPRTAVEITEVGYKYHMNNVNATIGSVQLDHIDPVIERHIANGRYLDQALQGLPGLSVPQGDPLGEPAYWFYTVLADDRDGLSRRLTERGIDNSTVHKRNDEHPVFAGSRKSLPGLDAYQRKVLHLPCGWWVGDADRERIVATLREGW